MDSIRALQEKIVAFRDARDWKQFHNAKELALCLSVEAAELLEVFQWKRSEDANRERMKEELADVFYAALLLAHDEQFDVSEIVTEKIKKTEVKYPVHLARGSAKKYTEF